MPEKTRDNDIPKTKDYDNKPVLIDDLVERFVDPDFVPPSIPMFLQLSKSQFRPDEPLNIPRVVLFLAASAAPYNSDFFVWNLFG